jgi:hypothetical protein
VADDGHLRREFALLTRYLGAEAPDPALTGHYVAAHATMDREPIDRFDRWLAAIARRGLPHLALADAYARRARPYGLLRRKLTLALALLEMSPRSHARFDGAREGSAVSTWGALALAGGAAAARLLVAVLVLAPLHLTARLLPARG